MASWYSLDADGRHPAGSAARPLGLGRVGEGRAGAEQRVVRRARRARVDGGPSGGRGGGAAVVRVRSTDTTGRPAASSHFATKPGPLACRVRHLASRNQISGPFRSSSLCLPPPTLTNDRPQSAYIENAPVTFLGDAVQICELSEGTKSAVRRPRPEMRGAESQRQPATQRLPPARQPTHPPTHTDTRSSTAAS